MKRSRILMLALGSSLLTATSCQKDLLEQTNPNAQSTATFWKTAKDAQSASLAMYSSLQAFATYGLYWQNATLGRSDESYSTSPFAELALYLRFVQTNPNFQYSYFMYNDFYRGMLRCNQVIANVPNINMDPTLRNRIVAEARFTRALIYFDMSTLFGNIPHILEVSTPSTRVKQQPARVVQDTCIADLLRAIPSLPERGEYSDQDRGRATQGGARALLGRIYMQRRQWQEASEQFAAIISKGAYSLVPNYSDNFTLANENNAESLFEVQFSDQFTDFTQDVLGAKEGGERAQFYGPPGIGFNDVLARKWVFDEFKDTTRDGQADPRRAATIFSANNPGQLIYGKTWAERNYDPSIYYWHKYQDDGHQDVENFTSAINCRLIRYADVLLMQAECLIELNQLSAAADLMNQVRNRVNIGPIPTGLSQADMRKQLQHERVTELAGEGFRWYDINRWGYLDTQAGVDQLKVNDSDFDNFVIGKSQWLPIPQLEIDQDPNIKQNPGY